MGMSGEVYPSVVQLLFPPARNDALQKTDKRQKKKLLKVTWKMTQDKASYENIQQLFVFIPLVFSKPLFSLMI